MVAWNGRNEIQIVRIVQAVGEVLHITDGIADERERRSLTLATRAMLSFVGMRK